MIKKLSKIKNLKAYLILYVLIMLLVIFFLLLGKNWLFFVEYYSFGFFNGYSQSKFLWFFVIMFLFLGYNFIIKKRIEKNKTFEKIFNPNTKLNNHSNKKNTPIFGSNFKNKLNKNLNLIIFFIFILLATLSLSSQLVFLSHNGFDLFNLSYLIYDNDFGLFTGTSITHIHTFKPVIGLFAPLFGAGDFDFAQSISSFMPQWFFFVYLIGFILLVLFILLLITKSKNFFEEKNIDWLNLFLFICASYLLTKSIVDGGALTTEFLVGSVYLIYTLFFCKKEKKYFYLLLLSGIILVIDFFIRYSVVTDSIKNLLTKQLITLAIKGVVTVSGLLFFVLVLGLILSGIFSIIYLSFVNNKFLLKDFFSKKKIFAIIFVILFFSSFIFLFTYFKVEKAVKEESILMLEEKIPKGTTIGYISYSIKDDSFIDKIDDSRELTTGVVKKDTTIQELSVWPKNIKSKDYIFVWKETCSIPIERKIIYVKTSEELLKIKSNSMIFLLNERKNSDNLYSIDFLHPTCIVDVRALIVEYLKKRGLSKFIVYN